LTEAQTAHIRVQLEVNGMTYEASGSVEEIVPQLLSFMAKAVPAYDIAKRLVYVSDLSGLADRIADYARMTLNGQPLLTGKGVPTERAVCIVLFMSYLAEKMRKRETGQLTVEEIATAVGKAPKTIRNVIVALQKEMLIERTDRGRYRITQRGLLNLETTLSSNSADSIAMT